MAAVAIADVWFSWLSLWLERIVDFHFTTIRWWNRFAWFTIGWRARLTRALIYNDITSGGFWTNFGSCERLGTDLRAAK